MSKYNNHQTGLDMLAAFEDFRKDLIQNIQGQIFNDNFLNPYFINKIILIFQIIIILR